jgi:hypothetical protein
MMGNTSRCLYYSNDWLDSYYYYSSECSSTDSSGYIVISLSEDGISSMKTVYTDLLVITELSCCVPREF